MLLSRKWLNKYVDVTDLSSDKISDVLTQLGIEVESVVEKSSLDEKLVVGRVVKAEPHPNADSLRVCEVEIADDLDNLSIVCGAPNAREGLYVAVALVGAVLPGNFKIKKTKIRSIPSFGMLCSEKELEVSDNHEGIIELPEDCRIGQKVSTIIDTSDSIFDLSLTPNRSDCLSYIGVARELGAKLGKALKTPSCDYKSDSFETKDHIEVNVESSDACARFVALYVKGITVIPSPSWLVKSIESSGMRSVNLVVDLTNYVMLEQGQPVHAYDIRDLSGSKINVKVVQNATSFKTLDEKTVDLNKGDIVIADDSKIVGLAGIMGGKNSEVKDDTKDIVIEVAQFSPSSVRLTSKRLSLHTESSHRFERGIDIENIPYVAKRLSYLIQSCLEEAGTKPCQVAAHLTDSYRFPRKELRVALRLERVKKILALPFIKIEECVKNLESIGLKLLDKTNERMLFSVPSWRHDIVREIDLVEEVGRLVGLDKIPSELPVMNIAPNKEDPFISFQDDCRFIFASLGLSEVITYPFSSKKDYENLLCSEKNFLWPSVQLTNALNEEDSYMQTSLLPSLLKSVLQNRNYGNRASQIFEVSRGYFDVEPLRNLEKKSLFFQDLLTKKNYLESDDKKQTTERNLVSGVLDAPQIEKNWRQEEKDPNFYDIKLLIEKFFHALNINSIKYEIPSVEECPFLHPSASARIVCSEKVVGFLGELHPKVAFNYGLANRIPVAFELDLDQCLLASPNKIKVEAQVKKYPPVSRDLAFKVKNDVVFSDFKEVILKNPRRKYLSKMELFDVYEGDNLPEGFKSFASQFTFQARDKTLSEKEINKEVDSLVKWLESQIDAEQR